MSSQKLKYAPLQEVVFEVTWKLPSNNDGMPYDPGFMNAFGLFARDIQHRFPMQIDLHTEASSIPSPYRYAYQFRKEELSWPVVQIGPGKLSVNTIEQHYVWLDIFRPAVEFAISTLTESYPSPLEFESFKLQYYDAVNVPEEEANPVNYLSKNFLTTITNQYTLPGPTRGLRLEQRFGLSHDTMLSISIFTATNVQENKNAIIWVTQAVRTENVCTQPVLEWLDFAHDQCSEIFKNMLSDKFYASFDE